MTGDLRFVCQSLLSNRGNISQYDAILQQFISAVQIDENLLANFASDESFPTLLQCLSFSLNRSAIPAPREGKVPKRVLGILQFMTQIAHQNPDIAHIMAANISGDIFMSNVFKRSCEDTQSRNANPHRYLPFLKLVAVLACESDLFLSSTESLGYYFTVSYGLFQTPEVGKWAIASFAALLKNCPIASSFIKASPLFARLKTTLAALLSDDDPGTVIASLAVLVSLFPSAVTPETSVKAAVRAVETMEGFAPSMHLVSWIVQELNESAPLAAEDIWKLLQCAMKGGTRAFVAYNLLVDLSAQHLMIVDVMQSMNCLFAVLNSLLESDEGFVAVAGCTFLFTVFQDMNEFVLSEDVVEPFVKALHLVLAMRKLTQRDRREAGVLLMRFMVRSRESVTYVVRALQEHEQPLFLDFQRQIEQNNAYMSVIYFLFLYDASHFLTHWRQKLIALVLESQFPGLLTHVVTASRNRCAIGDALRASQILADGFTTDGAVKMSPMFESLVSGYLLLNRQRYEQDRKHKAEITRRHEEVMSRLGEVEVERDCCEKEIVGLRSSLEENNVSIMTEQQQAKTLSDENVQLKKSLYQARVKAKKYTDRISELEDANVGISQQVESLRQMSANSSIREAGIRTKMTSIAQLEEVLEKSQNDNVKLDGTLKTLRTNADRDRQTIEALKQKLLQLKQKNARSRRKNVELSEDLVTRNTEFEHLSQAYRELRAKYDELNEQREQMEEREAENTRLRESLKVEIEKVKHDRDLFFAKVERKLKTVATLQNRVSFLEDRENEFQMLIKLIHKTTSSDVRLPTSVASFMKM